MMQRALKRLSYGEACTKEEDVCMYVCMSNTERPTASLYYKNVDSASYLSEKLVIFGDKGSTYLRFQI